MDLDYFARPVCCVVAAVLAWGCTSKPELEQQVLIRASDSSDDAYDTYGLQSSLIKIEAESSGVKATSEIVDAANGTLFQLFLDDPFYQTSVLNIAKRQGTSVVETAGVKVIDSRKQYIAAAGKALTTLIPLAAGVPFSDEEGPPPAVETATLPIYFRPEDVLRQSKPDARGTAGAPADLPSELAWGVRGAIPSVKVEKGVTASFGAVPHNAVAIADVVALGRHDFDGLYLSACRDMALTVLVADKAANADKVGGGKAKQSRFFIKVADPFFMVRQPFPQAGKIRTHTSCGASTEHEIDAEQAAPLPGIVETLSETTKAVSQTIENVERAEEAQRKAEEAARKAKEAEKKAKEAEQKAREQQPVPSPPPDS